MKTKWGALVVDGRGKIGGHVASKNRAGSYFRTKVTPANPQTTAQLLIRNRLARFSRQWRNLTGAQVKAWNGATSNFSKTDIFGDKKSPTGFNLFQMLNSNLTNAGADPILVPPLPKGVPEEEMLILTATKTGNKVSFTMTGQVPANSSLQVWATPQLSKGISFVKSEYRQIDILHAGEESPIDVSAAYSQKFGALTAGLKLYVKVNFIDTTTGMVSLPQERSIIIAG